MANGRRRRVRKGETIGSVSDSASAISSSSGAASRLPESLSAPSMDNRATARSLMGGIESVTGSEICGWAWDPDNPEAYVTLELLDGEGPLLTIVADEKRPDLNDGRHGFRVDLGIFNGRRVEHQLHVRFAETGMALPGSPVDIDGADTTIPSSLGHTEKRVAAGETDQYRVAGAADKSALGADKAVEPTGAADGADTVEPATAHYGDRTTVDPDDPLVTGIAKAVETQAAPGESPAHFEGFIDGFITSGFDGSWQLGGWAHNPNRNEPLSVELVKDNEIIASAVANGFRSDLRDAGKRQGECAFRIHVPDSVFDGHFHHLRVYATGYGRRELIGKPFGAVFPRRRRSVRAARGPVSATQILEQITAGSTRARKQPDRHAVEEIATVLQQIAERQGHGAALGLLYAYVLRRPIDNDGLVSRLTRIHTNPASYVEITEEVMYSEEAKNIHGPKLYATLHPIEYLMAWIGIDPIDVGI